VNFSVQQERALGLVEEWLQGTRPVFKLFGYAGTGKTTLARHIGADFYAAFTGKAAHVLRSKGCHQATTIHSLIYTPREKSRERLWKLQQKYGETPMVDREGKTWDDLCKAIKKEQDNLAKPSWTLNLESRLCEGKLLVIDECSMVNQGMGEDLLSFGCRILVLGDPAQLPPVAGGGYFTEGDPDVLLTEVHRQKPGSILDLATIIRETGKVPLDHELVHTDQITPKMSTSVDQLICGRNKTRRACNQRMRELLGHTDPLPVIGDKVVCTRNNHDLGILNGAVYQVKGAWHEDNTIELDNGLVVDYHPELFLDEPLSPWALKGAECFEYGYALTCHKAQGSQWDSVGIIDESYAFGFDQSRWLYTAVTRAAKQLWLAV
jgi:exodeoxyribonuclease-5